MDVRQQSIRAERSQRGDRKDYDQLRTATVEQLAKRTQHLRQIKFVTEQIVQLEAEYSQLGDKMEYT